MLASTAVVAMGLGLAGPTVAVARAGVTTCATDGSDADPFLVEDTTDTGDEGSLRCALEQANANAGADTITFSSGVTGTVALGTTLPITDDLDLQGPGADVVTLQGPPSYAALAVSDPSTAAPVVTISGLTITHSSPDTGRGIEAEDTALTLDGVVVTGNVGDDGAGIHIVGIDHDASLSVVDSTISGNASTAGVGIDGGGIYADEASVDLDNVSLVDNSAAKYGGGLSFTADGGADLTITGSTITGNAAAAALGKYGAGGGIAAFGGTGTTISIDDTTFADNSASSYGGGIAIRSSDSASTDPVVTITGSTISGNTLTNPVSSGTKYEVPGAYGGGIALATAAPALVTGSTISGNSIAAELVDTESAAGGGLVLDGPVTIENSTISGNTAGAATTDTYTAAPGVGGGIATSGDAVIRSSTITGNSATTSGGGIEVAYSATVTNTIVAGNNAETGPDIRGGDQSSATAAAVPAPRPREQSGRSTMRLGARAADRGGASAAAAGVDATWSLIGDSADAGLLSPDTDLLDVDPELGDLADNGGPTLTHLPLAGSPAINAGDPAFAPPPDTDQRGMPRVVEGRIDIGAVETGAVGCPADPTDNEQFVCEVYLDVLGREIDQAGFLFWVDLLDHGTTTTSVSFSVLSTPEYRQVEVTSAYDLLLGRAPDPSGLGFFEGALEAGAPIEAVEASLAASPEYFDAAGGTNATWLDALYQDLLGRPVDGPGAAHWQAQLAGGSTRTQVALAVAMSSERHARVVGEVFEQYLDRAPDASGLAWGQGLLDGGMSRQRFTSFVIGSAEYYALADGEPDN